MAIAEIVTLGSGGFNNVSSLELLSLDQMNAAMTTASGIAALYQAPNKSRFCEAPKIRRCGNRGPAAAVGRCASRRRAPFWHPCQNLKRFSRTHHSRCAIEKESLNP
jgi:hypothetical protein